MLWYSVLNEISVWNVEMCNSGMGKIDTSILDYFCRYHNEYEYGNDTIVCTFLLRSA